MKEITLQIPTLGEMLKGQLQKDLNRCREIIVSIKNDIKESFIKTYSPSCMPFNPWWNRGSHNSSKEVSQEPNESEEDEEIKKLEEQIKKIKQKQNMQKILDKKIYELENMNISLERQKEQIEQQKDEIIKLQKEMEALWK